MSHCALQEWCLKETIYENLLCKNIEIIYHKMMIAWSIPPDELSREDKYIKLYKIRTETGWTDRNVHSFEPQIWKPTLQDIEDDILSGFLHAEFKGKLVEILNSGNWSRLGLPLPPAEPSQILLEEPLNGKHLGFVKDLKDLLLAMVSEKEEEGGGGESWPIFLLNAEEMVSLVEDDSSHKLIMANGTGIVWPKRMHAPQL
jgi:hypothetical protein